MRKGRPTTVSELAFRYARAQQAVFVNPLSWLVEFLQVEIHSLPARGYRFTKGWRDLGDELIVFSLPPSWNSVSEMVSVSDLEYRPGKQTIEKIQRELKRGISSLMKQESPRVWKIPRLSPSAALVRLKTGKVTRVYRSGVLRDRFLMTVTDLLQGQGQQLRMCPVCQRLFVVVKRQTYCSPRCSQNTRTKKYRTIHKDALRVKRRQRLETKMQARYGPKVKIARRPRKA